MDDRLVVVTAGRDRHQTAEDALWLRAWLLHLRATQVVHGDCRHACANPQCVRRSCDQWAGECARRLGIQVRAMPADWGQWGKGAGPRRNISMLDLRPVGCLALPGTRGLRYDGRLTGTGHTVHHALTRRIFTRIRGEHGWP